MQDMSRKNIVILFSILVLIFVFFIYYVMHKSIFSGFKFGGPSEELKDRSKDLKPTGVMLKELDALKNQATDVKPPTTNEMLKSLNKTKPKTGTNPKVPSAEDMLKSLSNLP